MLRLLYISCWPAHYTPACIYYYNYRVATGPSSLAPLLWYLIFTVQLFTLTVALAVVWLSHKQFCAFKYYIFSAKFSSAPTGSFFYFPFLSTPLPLRLSLLLLCGHIYCITINIRFKLAPELGFWPTWRMFNFRHCAYASCAYISLAYNNKCSLINCMRYSKQRDHLFLHTTNCQRADKFHSTSQVRSICLLRAKCNNTLYYNM